MCLQFRVPIFLDMTVTFGEVSIIMFSQNFQTNFRGMNSGKSKTMSILNEMKTSYVYSKFQL